MTTGLYCAVDCSQTERLSTPWSQLDHNPVLERVLCQNDPTALPTKNISPLPFGEKGYGRNELNPTHSDRAMRADSSGFELHSH